MYVSITLEKFRRDKYKIFSAARDIFFTKIPYTRVQLTSKGGGRRKRLILHSL